MLKTLIAAVCAFAVFASQAYAGERLACTAAARQSFSTACLDTVPKNFSPWVKYVNYCPIPPKERIEQTNYCPLPST